jgi:beta-lactamase regulating signal transducer with metallopeptidase domain
MQSLDQAARWWLDWALAASWQLALLVVIVAGVCYLARGASPRLRHALWLLVVVKVFLPPGLGTPLSLGYWAARPLLETTGIRAIDVDNGLLLDRAETQGHSAVATSAGQSPTAHGAPPLSVLLMAVWLSGGLLFWAMIASRYTMVRHIIGSARLLEAGPVRVVLEQIARELKLHRVPDLLVTETLTVPFLFGVARPRIVLPEALLAGMSDVERRTVLTHELVHWKRRDTWIGWLQVVAQSLFWFHPFLWWAGRQLRHERECACDETVLRLGHVTPRRYGESILHVLTESRARSLASGSLVGVFEPGAKLHSRLEEIMNYEPIKREFNWASRLAIAAFAILFLPMAPGVFRAPLAVAAEDKTSAKPAVTEPAKTPYPQIVKTIPERGAIDVGPDLPEVKVIYFIDEKTGTGGKIYQTEISVTFDRDMSRGMSWTGDASLLPPTEPKTRPARWIDARTCVLPVSLYDGKYYRVGINSTDYQNFRDATGVPVPPAVITFVTTGASDEIKQRLRVPKIVALRPENGANDIDPTTKSLEVTFDVPMGDGMSWTGSGLSFPQDNPDGEKASWSEDRKQCTLPVVLEAGHEYELGLNSLKHINFQSKWGIPLEPVDYKFRTKAAKQ